MYGTTKTCYTCLRPNKRDLLDMAKTDRQHRSYLDKLKCLLDVDLPQSNNPLKICRQCTMQLQISYRFMEMVRVTQETLRKHLEELKIQQLQICLPECSLFKKGTKDVHRHSTIQTAAITTNNEDLKVESDDCPEEYQQYVETFNEQDSDSDDYVLSNLKNDLNELKNDLEEGVIIKAEQETKDASTIKEEIDVTLRKGRPKKYKRKVKFEINYECYNCSLKFNKRWKLQKHISRVHNDDKKYVCTYCNKSFKQSYHLREHLTAHTGERNYTCSFCGKSFQRISSMRRHIRSHEAAPGHKTKRTPFLCTVCGKSFPFSNGVQRHMRIHLGIKNHECDVCHRKFTQSTHLHVHMRTHTGEKPYICDTCGDAFSLNASLQKHMTVHQTVMQVPFVVHTNHL